MTPLKQFMDGATQILDAHERRAMVQQPAFFVRTTWLFSELELLSTPGEADLFRGIKIARLNGNIGAVAAIVAQIEDNTQAMEVGRARHERGLVGGFIREQLKREQGND